VAGHWAAGATGTAAAAVLAPAISDPGNSVARVRQHAQGTPVPKQDPAYIPRFYRTEASSGWPALAESVTLTQPSQSL
jgi:hypothetical protein